MNGWEYADDASERWERVEMETDRMEEAMAQKDAEIERLRGLLSIARDGLVQAVGSLSFLSRYAVSKGRPDDAALTLSMVDAALSRSDPDAQPED